MTLEQSKSTVTAFYDSVIVPVLSEQMQLIRPIIMSGNTL
jgi:hypothetical protein